MTNIVALDVGGTKIEGVLFDSKYRQLDKIRLPTAANKPRSQTVKNIVSVIEQLRGKNKYPIGIAMAGYPELHWGAPNIPHLVGFNLNAFLNKKFKTKVAMENDARCFALAEATLGAAKAKKNVVGVILGTGVGGGVIVDGKLLGGRDRAAGHIGHMIIDEHKSFETWCAGPGIAKVYFALTKKKALPSEIWKLSTPAAKKVQQQTYKHLGAGFANIVHLFNPDMIVVGGGLSNLPIYAGIKKEMKAYDFVGLHKGVKVVKNKLGDSAGVYGAAILTQRQHL